MMDRQPASGPDPVMEVEESPCVERPQTPSRTTDQHSPTAGETGPGAADGSSGDLRPGRGGAESEGSPRAPAADLEKLPPPASPRPGPALLRSSCLTPPTRNHAITKSARAVPCFWSIPKEIACISQPQTPLHPLPSP